MYYFVRIYTTNTHKKKVPFVHLTKLAVKRNRKFSLPPLIFVHEKKKELQMVNLIQLPVEELRCFFINIFNVLVLHSRITSKAPASDTFILPRKLRAFYVYAYRHIYMYIDTDICVYGYRYMRVGIHADICVYLCMYASPGATCAHDPEGACYRH